MNLQKLKTRLSLLQTTITLLTVIAGGIFAYVEYSAHGLSKQRDASVSLVSEYYKVENLEIREALDDAWRQAKPVLTQLMNGNPDQDQDYRLFVLTLVEQSSHEMYVLRLLSFFERVARCIQTEVCDDTVANEYFFDAGRIALTRYYSVICKHRSESINPSILRDTEKYFLKDGSGTTCEIDDSIS